MSVNKDPNGNWMVSVRHKDYTGKTKQTLKRGFKTKREGQEWEREFLSKENLKLDMLFSSFVEIYTVDIKNRVKLNTWQTKKYIIATKILPYFQDRKINEIRASDIIAWQNQMMRVRDKNGNKYSPTYLKTIHNQLSAIFNHAIKFYELQSNPAEKAGNMGREKNQEMPFWTKEEYLKFSDSMMDKPISFYAFELLYWCGLRVGELLALTSKDFNFEKSTVRINKSYQRIEKEDIVTEPKTPKSNRTISMPDFLSEEIQEYIKSIYKLKPTDRIFPISKHYLHNEMDRGSKEQNIKRIRVHDIRHSHVSLLIDMGFSAVAIADRVGHESIDITYRYAHLFPTKQAEIADKLSIERSIWLWKCN